MKNFLKKNFHLEYFFLILLIYLRYFENFESKNCLVIIEINKITDSAANYLRVKKN